MSKKILIAIVLIIGLVIAWWLISPIWRTVTLDEALPGTSQIPVLSPVMTSQPMPSVSGQPTASIIAQASLVAKAHDVSGKALLVRSGGDTILRFENLNTINGPDLRIYLSADLGVDDAIDLGPIRATQGNVNYVLPAGTDLTKYRNVLIWCRAFRVLFSYATF